MPKLHSIGKILIMLFRGDHGVAHVHVIYKEQVAIVRVSDGNILAGKVSGKVFRAAWAWIREHREEIEKDWNQHSQRALHRAAKSQRSPTQRNKPMLKNRVHRAIFIEHLSGGRVRVFLADGRIYERVLAASAAYNIHIIANGAGVDLGHGRDASIRQLIRGAKYVMNFKRSA